ncbi:hypothetical protein C8Q78DRAFT_1020173 [Trametes maxima]|nr:hypothetical protein C8Q78DRAFT_1020173 [Trametes maxima]
MGGVSARTAAPSPGQQMSYAGPRPTLSLNLSAGRGELFPSMISTSTTSGGGMPISPMPSEDADADVEATAESGANAPRMRDTMVSSAGASVVRGAGHHSSLSAEAMMDPFADPSMGAHVDTAAAAVGGRKSPAPEVKVSKVEPAVAVDPFADPKHLAPGQERLSMLTQSDVEPGEAM